MKKKLLPLILILSACGQRPVVDCDNSPASRNETCSDEVYAISPSYTFQIEDKSLEFNKLSEIGSSEQICRYRVNGIDCEALASMGHLVGHSSNTYLLRLDDAKTVDPRGWTTNNDCSVEPTGDKFVLVVGPTVSALYRYGAQ